MNDKLLNIDEVVEFTGIDRTLLARLRIEGGGPTFIKVGHRTVRYWLSDVVAWLNARRFESTAQYESTR